MDSRAGELAARNDRLVALSSIASKVLLFCAAFVVVNFVLALQVGHPIAVMTIPAVIVVALVFLSRTRAEIRILVAMVVLCCFAGVLAAELVLDVIYGPAVSQVPQGRRGVDTRSPLEVVRDMRSAGDMVFPSGYGPTTVNGKEVRRLSILPNRRTVFCNESGQYTILKTDEHGFTNPSGLWNVGSDVVIVGDSMVHGSCVPYEKNLVGVVREVFPATLGLGRPGAGPLSELAIVREYASLLRPKVVVWCYHDNDLTDLNIEKYDPILRSYLSPGFTQRLAANQEAINAVLEASLPDFLQTRSSRWPAWARATGIPENAFPLWVKDLIVGSGFTRLARTIRFDQVYKRMDAALFRAKSEDIDVDLFERILRQAKADVESWGGTLYFAYIPGWAPLYFSKHPAKSFQQLAFSTANHLELPVIDTTPAMKSAGDLNRIFFYQYSHPNDQGYRLIGTSISDFLRQHAPKLRQRDSIANR